MMPFTQHRGVALPLLRDDIDTDAIIPSREMRTVSRSGLAAGLFAPWRYLDPDARTANPDFALNQSEYTGASILLAGDNFSEMINTLIRHQSILGQLAGQPCLIELGFFSLYRIHS